MDILFTFITYATMFNWLFSVILLGSIVLYLFGSWYFTERRAASFKALSIADNNYNQKATDSLLNFETVKYFTAEQHEQERFEKALDKYTIENVKVSKGLYVLNTMQSLIICAGLASILLLGNKYIMDGEMTAGDFIMFNAFNMQIYTPLGFLGYLWKQIRQNMVNVEQVLNLLEQDDIIKEKKETQPPSLKGGSIEFKNVTFTYD